MSISVLKEGEVMGRGVPPSPELTARLLAIRDREPETIAILGAGPAGLLAAHAVALAGRRPVVFSAPGPEGEVTKSEIGAATYLHEPIPDLTTAEPDAMVRFVKVGSGAGYALKVYGDKGHPCSWPKFKEGQYPAWDLQSVYDDLWRLYSDIFVPADVNATLARDLIDTFPLVISSIPGRALCEDPTHMFPSRTVWVKDEAMSMCEMYGDPVIVYDGRVGAIGDRFRSSLIFGRASTEYARHVLGAREGIKVLATDCNCLSEIVRVGRWGEWKPGVLTHHAFKKTWDLMFDQFEGS